MKRRNFIKMGAAIVGGAALAGCQGGGEDRSASDAEGLAVRAGGTARPRGDRPVTVALVATGAEGPRIALQIQLALQSLKDSGEGTNLTHTLITSASNRPDGIVEAIKSAASDDRKIDLIYVAHDEQLEVFDRSDLLVPVDEMLRSDPDFSFDDYFPSGEQSVILRGRHMGLPLWIRPAAFAYDVQALSDAGVDRPDGTWDWTDLLEASKKLTVGGTGGPKNRYGFAVSPLITPLLSYIWQNGGDVLDEGSMTSRIAEPRAVEAVEFVRSLAFDHEVIPRLNAGANVSSLSARFPRGGPIVDGVPVAMAPLSFGRSFGMEMTVERSERGGRVEVTVDMEVLVDADGNSITTSLAQGSAGASLPHGKVDANLARLGGLISVLSTTADADAAWRGARQLARALEPVGTVPARRITPSELQAIDGSLSDSEAEAIVRAAQFSRIPTIPRKYEILTILRDEVDVPTLRGEVEPEAALKNAADAIDELLQQ